MRRSSQMRRKTMRSMVRWTEKLRSRCESFGLRSARLRARSERQFSISLRNASSTSAVPRFAFADAKAVIRRLGRASDFDRIFVDDVFVCFGITAHVVHVPAERLKHWIDELAPKLRLVVST